MTEPDISEVLAGALLENDQLRAREERIEKSLKNLASYAITARRTNQPEWMDGDALNAVEAERERCFRIFMRYYDAQNFTPDEIRAALKP